MKGKKLITRHRRHAGHIARAGKGRAIRMGRAIEQRWQGAKRNGLRIGQLGLNARQLLATQSFHFCRDKIWPPRNIRQQIE